MFLISNPHSQSITSFVNCRRLDQEGQSVKAWSICRSRLCVGPKERPKRKRVTMKVMIPAALLHLPGLSCLNRYHLSPFVKEKRNYWVTGLVSLPKCLKASKWHFLSKGQGWHRHWFGGWQMCLTNMFKCPASNAKACSFLVKRDACLGFQLFVFPVTLPIKADRQDVARESRTGWISMWSHQAGDGAGRHVEENVSLWSPLLPTGKT